MSPPPDRTATLEPRDAGAGEPCEIDRDESSWPSDDPGRYEQIAEHARGGLGRVVRAIDHRLRRTVAVKQLLRHDDAHEQRFVREALITARLQHPGIVPVHEAGRWPNGEPYYVMKLVEGRTLKELIASAPTLRDRLALLPNVVAIADTIAYAHSEGVIHRDVKPANVVVGSFGETVVVDWGLALDRDRRDEQTDGAIVGTPAYMPPEQARGEPVDERADVYALGAVLYELLAGAAPYSDADTRDVLARVIAGPPKLLSRRVPHELAGIVAKAMARAREDRYPDARAFAEDLRRFQTGKLVRACSYPPWQLARKKLAQHPRLTQVALAAMIATMTVELHSLRKGPVVETCTISHAGTLAVHEPAAAPLAFHVVLPAAVRVRSNRHAKLPCHSKYVTVAGSQIGDESSVLKGS